MRITEALKILQAGGKTGQPLNVALACGFTPLHLGTLLSAHIQQRMAGRGVELWTGLFGDLTGTIESLRDSDAGAIAVLLEWADLDPRLGFRSAGRWGVAALDDIVANVPHVLHRLTGALENIPRGVPIAMVLPTLPLPPLFHTPGWQTSEAETQLDGMLADFASELQSRTTAQLVNARRLAEDSAPALRFDLKSDLVTGLPYTVAHADAVASALARLLIPPAPKKGLITDLDDTLWSGLVGEVGPDAISWDLSNHRAIHGLYQKLLASFVEEGVLVAVASKNDAAVVERAFLRSDLLLQPESLFPKEVNWHAKSQSVARILKRWNISADSVVFVDDTPLELAEVAAAHPGIECIQFGGYDMLRRLRDLFGKKHLSAEDALRGRSIRQTPEFLPSADSETASEDFLKNLNASVSFDFPDGPADPRALELVNKTNQFNLNGIRFTESDWSKRLLLTNSFLALVSYEDKFGPLGKISVMQGQQHGRTLQIDVWVLSCRAFARRIEYRCLSLLFDRYEAEMLRFSFLKTAKNGPVADFLTALCEPELTLSRGRFKELCPPLYHAVKESRRVEVNG